MPEHHGFGLRPPFSDDSNPQFAGMAGTPQGPNTRITLQLYMASGGVIITARLLKWGNSYGIRLRKADLKKAGLSPGSEAVVRLSRPGDRIDLSELPTFSGGRRDDSLRHDQLLGRARRRAVEARKG